MNYYYCDKCGYGNVYTLYKPKVCAKCSQNFELAAPPVVASTPPKQTFFQPTPVPAPQPYYRQEPAPIRDFSNIDISASVDFVDFKNQGVSLGQAINNPTAPVKFKGPKIKPQKPEEVIAEFRKYGAITPASSKSVEIGGDELENI